jgi:hypothetical protein
MSGVKTGTDNSGSSQVRSIRQLFSLDAPTPRILLFFVAIILKLVASALSGIGFVLSDARFLIPGTVVWLIWFVVLFLIAAPSTDRLLQNQIRWLKPAALTIIALLLLVGAAEAAVIPSTKDGTFPANDLSEETTQVVSSFSRVFAYNDATALCHQGAENLIDGQNPYAEANIVSAMIKFNGSYDKSTPLREGRFADVFPYPEATELEQLWHEAVQDPSIVPQELESKLGYPAGCFVLLAPFIWMGITDIRLIYLLFVVLALGYVVWQAPRNLALWLLAAAAVSLELWNSIASGETGSLCFPFLLLGWVLPRKNLWLSALFMGLAVATKQIAWFFVPFYLILIFQTMGIKKSLSAITIVFSIFLSINIPFIIDDPGLWLTSLMAPITDNMFPLGIGIVSLISSGILDIRSPLIFSILEIGVAVMVIFWYFRNCRRYPHAGPVLAVLPLFFAWRSLWPYFFYADIIILAGIIIDEYDQSGRVKTLLISPDTGRMSFTGM